MNPFDKYFGKEDVLASQCASFLRFQYPKVLWWHTPNEGKRTRLQQYKGKKLGMLSGVCDILIVEPNSLHHGLAIELKVKPNKPTDNQKEFLESIEKRGFKTEVIYDFETFQRLVTEYFKVQDHFVDVSKMVDRK